MIDDVIFIVLLFLSREYRTEQEVQRTICARSFLFRTESMYKFHVLDCWPMALDCHGNIYYRLTDRLTDFVAIMK